MGGGKRRPNRLSGGRHSSTGEVSAKKKSESHGPNRKGNAVAYAYNYTSDDPSRPIQLASSTVVAFMDPTPSTDATCPVPTYNYDPSVSGGLGLGFRNYEEGSEEEEKSENEGKGEGFLSIGGVRVYTEDTSSPEDDASDSGDSIGSDSSEGEEEEGGESSDGSSSIDSDSEIDDEMVDDYLEGIGGSSELLNSGWLAKRNLEEEFLKFESSSDDGDDKKLGAIDTMNVSMQYGMMKSKKTKPRIGKGEVGSPVVEIGLSAAMDDLMFVKDPRTISGRRKKKKALSQLSRSWPREGQRRKEYYSVPGLILKHSLHPLFF